MSQRVVNCPGCLYSGQPHLENCPYSRTRKLSLFTAVATTSPPMEVLEQHDIRRWLRQNDGQGNFQYLQCCCGEKIYHDSNEAMFRHVAIKLMGAPSWAELRHRIHNIIGTACIHDGTSLSWLMTPGQFEQQLYEGLLDWDWIFLTLVRTTVAGFVTCLDNLNEQNIGLMKSVIRNGCKEILEVVKELDDAKSRGN